MFQKKNKTELEALTQKELLAHSKDVMARRIELLQKKKATELTPEEQVEFEEIAGYSAELDAMLKKFKDDKPAKTEKSAEVKYKPAKGEENIAILKLSRGQRFSASTGQRLAPVFIQKFNASEYRLFMAHYKGLGYTIEEVVYNPFKED